jgi:MFS family permease
MGVLGLVVAALVLLLIRETSPSRSQTEEAQAMVGGAEPRAVLARPSFVEAATTALRSRPFLLLIACGIMVSINYSAMLAWLPAYMQRVRGLDAAETGALLGVYKGFFGVAASLAAGLLVTWLMRFDRRWLVWSPITFCALMAPAQLMLLLAEDPYWWHMGLAVETVLLAAINPCLFALVITLLNPRMRATGTAIYLLIFNLVGQSLGPLVVGALNDGPLAALGSLAVRQSLLIAPAVAALGAILLFALSVSMGGRTPGDGELAPR